MKRVFVLAVLPVLLLALERVNLIKDAGFEKDSDVWLMYSYADGEYDSTIIKRHESDSASFGNYCGSIDGRIKPADNLPSIYYMVGTLCQIFVFPTKKIGDLDSLEISHMSIFVQEGNKLSAWGYDVTFLLYDSVSGTRIQVVYYWITPDRDPPNDNSTVKLFVDTLRDEGVWNALKRDIDADFIGIKGLSSEMRLDSFTLYGYSNNYGGWHAQKAFFDGVRLTGYADYDVGVKEILSGDSLEKDTPYTPIARIKNFGREDASDFSVIAEIFEGTTRVYYDSLPWSLTSDTEDTVTFAAFTPSSSGNHTLTVRTAMEPDESDEDDALSKTLFGSGIVEPVTQTSSIQLGIAALSSIRYSLPQNEQGTITLYDPTGRRFESLKVQGTGQVNLRSELTSGVYFVKLEAGKVSVTKKAVVLK